MTVHINSNYIHLTKNKPIDWRTLNHHCLPWFGQAQNLTAALWTLSSSAKKSLPTFFECAVAAALPTGLPRTSRAIPEIKKPFATSFHKPSSYNNALSFPPNAKWQETCKRYGRFIQKNQVLFSSTSLWNKPLLLLWTVLWRWTW